MNNREAIEWLIRISERMSTVGEDYFDVKRKEAVMTAIKTLGNWIELKETIAEMRDSGGTLNQYEVCRFLVNLMNIKDADDVPINDDELKRSLDQAFAVIDDYSQMVECREAVMKIINRIQAQNGGNQ